MAKMSVSRKVYVLADGTTSNRAKPNWSSLRFELFGANKDAEGKNVVVDTVDIPQDVFSAEIMACAAGHGLMQKIGDNMAGIEGQAKKDMEAGVSEAVFDPQKGYAAYARYLIEGMVDNLKAGAWVEEGEASGGAGNVTILLEATVAAYADQGKILTDAHKKELVAKFEDKAARDATRKIPAIAAHIARIVAERAAERAKKAQEALAKAQGEGDGAAAVAGLDGLGIEFE